MKHTKDKIKVDLQIATKLKNIPSLNQFQTWVNCALSKYPNRSEICIRIIDENESQKLNNSYRHQNHPTNILSFPYSEDDSNLLGDLAICAHIIEKESKEQRIDLETHWAHIVIHGCLHLIGYTHDTESEAEKMEELESTLLKELEF